MTIFTFLRLLQAAICSGLFAQDTSSSSFRFRPASAAAARLLGFVVRDRDACYDDDGVRVGYTEDEATQIELCPLTMVHAYLGRGYVRTGSYSICATQLGLPSGIYEPIVTAADTCARTDSYDHYVNEVGDPTDVRTERVYPDSDAGPLRQTMECLAHDCREPGYHVHSVLPADVL